MHELVLAVHQHFGEEVTSGCYDPEVGKNQSKHGGWSCWMESITECRWKTGKVQYKCTQVNPSTS